MSELEILPLQVMSEQDEQAVVQFVQEKYDGARAFDRPFKCRLLDSWLNFNNRLRDNWSFYWNVFLPVTQTAVNDTVENIMATVFPKENFFDLRAMSGQTELQTEIMREAQKYALRRARYKERYFFWEHDAIVNGNSVIATFAEPTFKKVTVEQPMMDEFGYGQQIGTQRVQQDKMTLWPVMHNISRFNCFPFPGPVEGGDIQTMPFFIVRRFLPLESVKAMAQRPYCRWNHTEELQGLYDVNRGSGLVSSDDELEFEDLWRLLAFGGWNVTGNQETGRGSVKFCEVLYYYEAPPGGRGCRAYAVTCENKLLACRGSEYEHALKPLADIKWQVIHPDLWQCIGVPEQIKAYQENVNIRQGFRHDSYEMMRRPMRVVGPGAGIKTLTDLQPYPGAMIPSTGDISQIKMLEFPNANAELFREDDNDRVGIQQATKITNVSKGLNDTQLGAGSKTAQGIAYLTDATNRASAFKTLFHEEIGVAPQLMQTAQILQQVLEPDTLIHLADVNETLKKRGVQGNRMLIHPDDIAGEWEFWAVGSSKVNDPATAANNMQQFWPAVLQDAEHGKKFDRMELYKDAHEMIFNRPITKYLKTDEELKQVEQTPPPLPPQIKVSLKDLDPEAKMQAEARLGLPVSQPKMSEREEDSAKDGHEVVKGIVKTVGKIAENSTKQPKYLPKRKVEPANA